jgi:hypothetical protein
MPLSKMQFRPGVTVELTPTANEGGWSASNLIRFFAGQVQKMGGWVAVPTVAKLIGICRGLFGWADLVGTAHVALGTEQRLYVLTGGVLSDITPLIATTNTAPALATTLASTLVTITDASYTPSPGDWVDVIVWVSQGGIVLAGFYQVVAVTGAHTYTVNAAIPATSTQVSGGAVPSYTTTITSATVSVVLANHGLSAGSVYQATVSTTFAGVTLFGQYVVAAIVDPNTFQITASALAIANATVSENSGNMQIQYLIPSGVAVNTAIGGWGVGGWGLGDWGQATVGGSSLILTARTWSLDHFGQDLIASPNMGKIYHWSPPTITPASVIDASAPVINRVVFAIAQTQIIMACGSEVGGNYFPTLVRWCDSGNFTSWVATTTNQAGSYQLPSGSFITAAMAVGLGALIWTDTDLWSVTYQGLPFVFGFNQIAVNCEALSKKAPAVIAQAVVWPSSRGFFRYSGGSVAPLDCPVWDIFFDNLDEMQSDQVCSAVNTLFDEVTWYFPAVSGGVMYVKWNFAGNVWDYGTLTRTAWIDHSPYGNPMATDDQGMIYMHETGNDANGMALQCFAESGYYDLGDGDMMQSVKVIIPDFIASDGANIEITALATDYPGEPPRTYGPFTVTPSTRRLNVSLRARQVAFRFGSSDLGSFWRIGAVRYQSKQAGARP